MEGYEQQFMIHTMTQLILDFRLLLGMPLVQGVHMDPKWLESAIHMVQQLRPPEIGAPGTPGVSRLTKISSPKIFLYYPLMMFFFVTVFALENDYK